jgi:hypothetical protein
MFGLLFGMCRSHHAVETRVHEERKGQKKLQKDMKEVKKALYPNETPPPGSEERESNPPTPFEQRYASYESFDPSQPFAPYASQAIDAPPPPPPPPEQRRPSMADEIAVNIFGDPNPDMASSSHTSLHQTTMPHFFDSSLYTRPGAHWTAPHDYTPHNDH